MIKKLGLVTIYVKDQDQALAFYSEKLGLEKRMDVPFGNDRWLTVAPVGQQEVEIVLQKATTDERLALVGRAPTWVFTTDDVQREYEELSSRGVEFVYPPTKQAWGIDALFRDLYGNTFDLVQRG
jgi:catechol 2,3-dioxygenase-like lactoylglutathione lyase family enzyme